MPPSATQSSGPSRSSMAHSLAAEPGSFPVKLNRERAWLPLFSAFSESPDASIWLENALDFAVLAPDRREDQKEGGKPHQEQPASLLDRYIRENEQCLGNSEEPEGEREGQE